MFYQLFDDVRDYEREENGSYFSCAFINAFIRTM